MTISLIVADDHSMVRDGLEMFFEGDPLVQIVGTARDGGEAVALTRALQPHVVLMDLLMPVMNGIEATGVIRAEMPTVEIVAMTSDLEGGMLPEAIRRGAICCVVKAGDPEGLREAVLAAAEGRALFDPQTVHHLLRGPVASTVDPATLSAEQVQLLEHLARGHCNQEIARQMGMADGDVRPAVEALVKALGLAGRAQAVLYAVRCRIVALDEAPALSAAVAADL